MTNEDAIQIAKLWRAGKLIGGDEDEVRDALLREIEKLNVERDFARRELDRACQETREALSREVAAVRSTDEPSLNEATTEKAHRLAERVHQDYGIPFNMMALSWIPATGETYVVLRALPESSESGAPRGEAGDRAGPLVSPLPPDVLADALKDVVHTDTGPVRAGRAVKSTANLAFVPASFYCACGSPKDPEADMCENCYRMGDQHD